MEIRVNGDIITDYVKAHYTLRLDGKNTAEIHLSGQGLFDRNFYTRGATVEIIDEGETKFKGRIKSRSNKQQGYITLRVMGEEHYQYSQVPFENDIAPDDGVWKEATVETIAKDLGNNSVDWNEPTVDSALSEIEIDFDGRDSESMWNALERLASDTGIELIPDYDNNTLEIKKGVGSGRPYILEEYNDIGAVSFEERDPEALKVLVYGRGKGGKRAFGEAEDTDYQLGDPVKKIVDRTIVSDKEAQERAKAELEATKTPIRSYEFNITNKSYHNLRLGDSFYIDAPSAGATEEEVRVVKIKRGDRNGSSYVELEVTNKEYSRRLKDRNEQLIELNRTHRDTETRDDGSSNTLQFSNALNASSEAPLRTIFYLTREYLYNKIGKDKVESLLVDYEVEPFREGAGSAEEEDTEPDLSSDTITDSHKHDPSDDGHHHQNPSQTSSSVNVWEQVANPDTDTIDVGSSFTELQSAYIDTDKYEMFSFEITIAANDYLSSGETFEVKAELGGDIHQSYFYNWAENSYSNGLILNVFARSPMAGYEWTYLEARCTADVEVTAGLTIYGMKSNHSHDISDFYSDDDNADLTDDDKSPNVTGSAQGHNHNVTIGTQIGDADDINATEVSLYLEHWNEDTEEWEEKNSKTNIGSLLERDIDLSDDGTYPDSEGFWRIRTETNSSDPDYVQTQIRIKHELERD